MSSKCHGQDRFRDIRPYKDNEVPAVVAGLLANQEFIAAVCRFRFPRLAGPLGWLLKPMVRRVLKGQLEPLDSIAKLQSVLAGYMQKMIERTTSNLSFSGLEHLEAGKAYLFISNHRDIAMDPAFVNWGLYNQGLETVRIAIGDNLLRKPYISDLMRLNKSFIVRRSVKGVREKMKALMELSAYIDHSLTHGHSIWIAQREGRAKDGNDLTDPAIIKMLYMSLKKRGLGIEQMAETYAIVPVSISYEFDPCDRMKAQEIYEREDKGSYQKREFEDIDSIVAGIVGTKGDVHVAFGEPLKGDFASAEALAEAIDQRIITDYHLHASNRLAADPDANGTISADKRRAFIERVEGTPDGVRQRLVAMYANPVLNKNRYCQ